MALVVTAGLTLAPESRAQDVDTTKSLKVKAAFLYNFAKFVQWPKATFEDADAPFVIGVVGDDPFGSILDKTVKNKNIASRPIVVRRFNWDHERDRGALLHCHILFVSAELRPRLDEIRGVLRDHPVLIVGDTIGFARDGGMIGFALEAGRIVFEINRKALEAVGLRASAKLLKLAKIVETRKRRHDR